MLPQQLMFTVGLIDQITKPIAKISQQFNGLSSNYQAGTMKMASGVAGMAAAGYALTNALQPAIDMDRALGEVKSLGVRDSALKQLTDTSYEFALKYGKSATEFIGSSYDIQSAISGLNDADLSAFTLSSNVLATATKSDAATITNYMGTMFGIFKNQANGMGKSNWVEQVTGMTATAVQMFKTNGSEMSAAFTSIGAEGTSAGIGMNEQMAVLGTLQATMSGSEAGTKYKSFLAGVGKAQKSLGLEFTNSQGQMLPMVDILTKIKGKYGETLDVAESDALGKAFGSKEAAATVKLLMNDIDGLGGSIGELGKVKGMEQAEIMAAAMTDQSERLGQSWFVIRAAFGTAILPTFNKFAGLIADLGTSIVWFTEAFPNLTKYLGYATVTLLGLIAVGGLVNVMFGAGIMVATAYKNIMLIVKGVGAAWTAVLTTMRFAQIALNMAMALNPMGFLIAGITLAIAAVVGLIYWWDDLVKVVSDSWEWMSSLLGDNEINVKANVTDVNVPDMNIKNNTQAMPDILPKNVKPLMPLAPLAQTVPDNVKPIKPLMPLAQTMPVKLPAQKQNTPLASVQAIAPVKNQAQAGGITQQISNANQQKSTSIGKVNVYPAKGDTNFVEQLEMYG